MASVVVESSAEKYWEVANFEFSLVKGVLTTF